MSGAQPRSEVSALQSAFKVAAFAFLLASCTAWLRPLLLPDEGRYAGVAWEMLRSGDWLTPTLNGLAYFHKPPLFYWITAASLGTFGLNEWAARVAPAIGFTLAVASPFWLLARWLSPSHARLALFALAAQPLLLVGGQYANLDMLVAGLITLTVVLLAHAELLIDEGSPHARSTLRGAWAAAALGVLAKGLIGIVIPAGIIGCWLIASGRWRSIIRTLIGCPEGPLIFLLLAAPWFIAMEFIHPGFLDYFFVYQHFTRFATGGFNNPQPIWFYPAVLALFFLPWIVWITRRAFAPRLPKGRARDLVLLAWVWAAVVVAFFSAPRSKLLGYVLPAVPALALLATAGLLARGEPSARARRLWSAASAFGLTASLAAVVFIAFRPLPSSRELALIIAEQSRGSEPVFMIGRFDFDTGLYARLHEPIRVVERWDDEALIRSRDNWRKELSEARRFSPAIGDRTLITPERLAAQLCASTPSWIIGFSQAVGDHAVLAAATRIRDWRESSLWRFDPTTPAAAAFCATVQR